MTTNLLDNIDEVMARGSELIEYYIQNPIMAAYDLLNVDLAPIQRVVLRDMWFKNFVITVASRGFGKSSSVDSLTYIKDKGLVYLHEILPPIPTYLKSGDDEVIKCDEWVYTSDRFKASKRVALERNIVGIKIVTHNGFEHKGSKHHKLLVFDNDCEFQYKALVDLEIGDKVCIQRGQHVFGLQDIALTNAYFMGLYVNNECISDKCLSNKSVPLLIRQGTKNVQKSFLQGYFDTNSNIKNNSVVCYSTSYKFLKEIQLMLLNFGIVAKLSNNKTESRYKESYSLSMFSHNALLFNKLIGCKLSFQTEFLSESVVGEKPKIGTDVIPHALKLCYEVVEYYYNTYSTSKKPAFSMLDAGPGLTYIQLYKFLKQCKLIEDSGFSLKGVQNVLDKLTYIFYAYYFFDDVESVEEWSGDCYDFEMNMNDDRIEPNYFANGFINHNTFLLGVNAVLHALLYPGYRVGLVSSSFRQSKMIFSEIEKLYQRSSIFREACIKRPVRGADSCNVRFKSTNKSHGSFIEALPIGVDGAKIRGSRFYLIEIDELAQVPPQIIDMVLRPMAAVTLEPMQRVREYERQLALVEKGLIDESGIQDVTANKMMMTSSGHFKFNHMWDRMKSYWEAIADGEGDKYAVYQIPYQVLPKGFLDENNIKEAKRTMSTVEFEIEYEAKMVSDSDGFFKASLLESCTTHSTFTVERVGDSKFDYVLGIDPNQGGAASCGLVIIKLSDPAKIVYVMELKKKTLQEMVMEIQRLTEVFKLKRIFMDSQGGGKSIRDLLREGYNNKPPIIELTDSIPDVDNAIRILQLVNPTPSWISDANFDTLSLFENRSLLFPVPPMSASALEEKLYEEVRILKSQLLNIVVTQTARGVTHFDTPKKGQNKDLYSALVLASWGIKEMTRTVEIKTPTLHEDGYIRPHRTGAVFNGVSALNTTAAGVPTHYLADAVLKRNPK